MKPLFRFAVLLVSLAAAANIGQADLLVPGGTVIPQNDDGASPGTLLATQQRVINAFSSNNGIVSGKFTSAVYLDGGFDDFYYQVSNDATSTAAISLVQVMPFLGTTLDSVGSRTDGLALGGLFVDGTVVPSTVHFDTTGNIVAFNFISALVQPGQVSAVMILDTNATSYTPGTALIGDPQTVETFATPEPSSFLLLISGVLLALIYRGTTGALTPAKYRALR